MKKRTLIFIFSAIVVIVAIFLTVSDEYAMILSQQQVARDEVKGLEARFWQKLEYDRVQCYLCVHYCIVPTGERGICRVRENRGGRLYTLVYGLLAATQIAPIEKDGMQHALPGTHVLAIATAGCNFRCKQCHNWHITQNRPEDVGTLQYTPQEITDLAIQRGARTITGTINEPTVFFEFLVDFRKSRAGCPVTLYPLSSGISLDRYSPDSDKNT